jgi:hypothetical protein
MLHEIRCGLCFDGIICGTGGAYGPDGKEIACAREKERLKIEEIEIVEPAPASSDSSTA